MVRRSASQSIRTASQVKNLQGRTFAPLGSLTVRFKNPLNLPEQLPPPRPTRIIQIPTPQPPPPLFISIIPPIQRIQLRLQRPQRVLLVQQQPRREIRKASVEREVLVAGEEGC